VWGTGEPPGWGKHGKNMDKHGKNMGKWMKNHMEDGGKRYEKIGENVEGQCNMWEHVRDF